MMNRKDIESKIEAKRNEIESKDLIGLSAGSHSVKEAYPDSYEQRKREIVANALRATKVPKYVRLAKFLDEIQNVNVNLLQTKAFLAHEEKQLYGFKGTKTLYKEFQQIEKKGRKVSRRNARKLRKYKGVKTFVKKDLDAVYRKLHISGYISNNMGKEQFDTYYLDIEKLTNFFDVECTNELYFLRTSNLTRKVR